VKLLYSTGAVVIAGIVFGALTAFSLPPACCNETDPATSHWSFLPPQRPPLPAVQLESWVRNPIDYFVLAKLEQAGLRPALTADRRTLIRRVSLDLTGLPPTPTEVTDFLLDNRPDAYEHLVDRLLDSPRFGEHLALPWLQAARYADTSGFQHDFFRSVYPWRTWVITALNENMPFDQFVTAQLAGDLLPGASDEQILATCFLRLHRLNAEYGSIDEEFYVENTVDRVETVSTVFMGLTVGCARCHDHKFDPVTMADFYGLFAFLNNGEDPGVDPEGLHQFPYSKPILRYPNVDQRVELANLRADLETVAKHQATSATEDILANRQQEIEQQIEAIVKTAPAVMIMRERGERRPAFLLNRGNYQQRGAQIDANTPAILPSLLPDASRNRLGLAQWLTTGNHPLLGRVTVNRLWQNLFGTGIVKTAEDFGVRGERPSHPELLDWLAVQFSENGWDLKQLIRLIVNSASYRQSSLASSWHRTHDPENRLLARGPQKRLTAFAIRDQALAASGLLVNKIGGRPTRPYQPAGLWKEVSSQDDFPRTIRTSNYEVDSGLNLYRRSIYTFWKRSVPPPAMTLFDAPNRNVCTVGLSTTNTPLQALVLLNNTTYIEAARQLAGRMITEGGTEPQGRIERGMQLLLGRPPTSDETATLCAALDYHHQYYADRTTDAQDLLSHGASQPTPRIQVVEHAAWTQIALLLLNLDETIMLR